MWKKYIILPALLATLQLNAADYLIPGINLGLRATQMVLNESRSQKKEKREADAAKQKKEKEQDAEYKKLASTLKFRYRIDLRDVQNHPLFWQYAEKIRINKKETADVYIMNCLEKNDHLNAAKAINLVVNALKKDRKWQTAKPAK